MRVRAAEPAEALEIARVHDRCWRATYAELLPAGVLESSRLATREALWRDLLAAPAAARCAFVAEDDDGAIVGCAWGGPEESGDPFHRAELLGIYLERAAQGRGLGRHLVAAIAAAFARRGDRALLLWALAENWPARRFYEALGGRLLRERDTPIGGVPVPEVAYGWSDLGPLIAGGERSGWPPEQRA